jgi:hypothetical protein
MIYSAHIEYDGGRLGSASVHGLKSREAAIEWLDRAFIWSLCWYMSPTCWIESKDAIK